MGYITAFNLELKKLNNKQVVIPISIDDVINVVNNNNFSKEDILKNLEALKSGAKLIDEDYIINALLEKYEFANYALDKDGETKNSTKWYEHNENMLDISKEYPEWLFILSGAGEENGDLWKKYYLNGKVQVAKAIINYDDFDINKLS